MTRDELISAADRERIRPSSYSLDGGLPPEKYVLAEENGHWAVYYSERGERRDEMIFDSEQEAWDQLFLWLIEDRTTRVRRSEVIQLCPRRKLDPELDLPRRNAEPIEPDAETD